MESSKKLVFCVNMYRFVSESIAARQRLRMSVPIPSSGKPSSPCRMPGAPTTRRASSRRSPEVAPCRPAPCRCTVPPVGVAAASSCRRVPSESAAAASGATARGCWRAATLRARKRCWRLSGAAVPAVAHELPHRAAAAGGNDAAASSGGAAAAAPLA
eukprot:6960287-Prymnesium_polylepis.1